MEEKPTEQPVDYVIESFEELLQETYDMSPWWIKVVYKLQNHIFLTLTSSFALGYVVGAYLFKF